jgi:hypothetical protein
MRFVSEDGLWRITPICLDGTPFLRVEKQGLINWIWQADVTSPKEVAAFVPLTELHEVTR